MGRGCVVLGGGKHSGAVRKSVVPCKCEAQGGRRDCDVWMVAVIAVVVVVVVVSVGRGCVMLGAGTGELSGKV